MLTDDVNPYPIQLLLNYWELCPTLGGTAASFTKKSPLTEKLEELAREGITQIATFLPWQAIETDITHALPRFLHAAAERKLKVSLIVNPELGVHYPNSGLPKDMVRTPTELALHCDQLPMTSALPPNLFALPSLFSADLGKRYYSFLSRVDSVLGDLGRTHPHSVKNVTLITTGSFWKYYRSAQRSTLSPFAGPAGDFSPAATVIFRQRVEQFFSQREFQDPTPISANRWKTKAMDEVNRRWFFQQAEDVYKHRSFQMLRKKAGFLNIREIELYTPEADPGFLYSHMLQELSGGNADWARLSTLVDHAASRSSFGSASVAGPFVHWTSLGGFRSLADTQRQFLILKSLLLMGGQCGGILLDEADWFSLSHAFRSRVSTIGKMIQYGQLQLDTSIAYFSPHSWSGGGVLWDELQAQMGVEARMLASFEALQRRAETRLTIVDPTMVITREVLERLIRWAETGRTVALPRSTLYTESARAELEKLAATSRRMDINFDIPYHLYFVGAGKLALYEWDSSLMKTSSRALVQAFVASIVALSGVNKLCKSATGKVQTIPLRPKPKSAAATIETGGRSIFIFNETSLASNTELQFSAAVAISDFATTFARLEKGQSLANSREAVEHSSSFALDLAPCGIAALALEIPSETKAEAELATPDARTSDAAALEQELVRLPEFIPENKEFAEAVDAAAVLNSVMGGMGPGESGGFPDGIDQ